MIFTDNELRPAIIEILRTVENGNFDLFFQNTILDKQVYGYHRALAFCCKFNYLTGIQYSKSESLVYTFQKTAAIQITESGVFYLQTHL